MKDTRQVLLGILAAIVSAGLLFGSLSLALVEGNMRQAMAPTQTWPASPTPPPPGFTPSLTNTPAPGQTGTSTLTPTATLTLTPMPTSACNYPPGWVPVTVQPGDTLDSLADFYGVTPEELMAGNCLLTNNLFPDTILYVPGIPPTESVVECGPPPGWVFYTVRLGDTLWSLAQYFDVTVADLMFANCLTSDEIRAGQKLYVPNIPTPTFVIPPTNPPTRTPTQVPTLTITPTSTPVIIIPTLTPTASPTSTPTPTATAVPTPTPTGTPTDTPTVTPTLTPTLTPTSTPTITLTTETALSIPRLEQDYFTSVPGSGFPSSRNHTGFKSVYCV